MGRFKQAVLKSTVDRRDRTNGGNFVWAYRMDHSKSVQQKRTALHQLVNRAVKIMVRNPGKSLKFSTNGQRQKAAKV
jgi:hypothetical protein